MFFRKWSRRIALSLRTDCNSWQIWVHIQGSSYFNGEILPRHQKWGPLSGNLWKSLGLYELQVENHKTLIWNPIQTKLDCDIEIVFDLQIFHKEIFLFSWYIGSKGKLDDCCFRLWNTIFQEDMAWDKSAVTTLTSINQINEN